MFKTCRKWKTESFGRVMTGRKSLCVPVLGVMRNWGRHADLTFIIYILTSTSTCTIYNCDNHILNDSASILLFHVVNGLYLII